MSAFLEKFDTLELPMHGVRLPEFNIDARHKRQAGASEDVDNYEFLRSLCHKGFKKLKLKKDSDLYKKYVDRVVYIFLVFH